MASDRYKNRNGFLIGAVLIGVVGYAIMLSQTQYPNLPIGVKYFALFPLASAAQIVQPLTVGWMLNNVGGTTIELSPVPVKSASAILVESLRATFISLQMLLTSGSVSASV